MKDKRCRVCKDQFTPKNTTQVVCSYKCAIDLANQKRAKKERADLQEWNKRKKQIKSQLETLADKKKKLETVFNKYIRLRDLGKPCISCQRPAQKIMHAGHLYSVGFFPELRFDPDNVHAQCEWCNIHLHGNGALYRINLEKKISPARLKALDERANKPKNYLEHEILELIEYYKYRVKEIKKQE